jgi:hypothetical protein
MAQMIRSNFAVFILTHGRPDNVITFTKLKQCGYTGRIFIIIDDEDSSAEKYYRNFGKEQVIVFNKAEIAETIDTGDTQQDRRSTVFARNASFKIAKDLGLDYFMQLDDDYRKFEYRYPVDHTLKSLAIRSLDEVFEAYINLLIDTNALTVAMAQGGDFINGIIDFKKSPIARKAMNTFIFRTDRPMAFIGRMNDDVNSFLTYGSRGELILTAKDAMVTQLDSQLYKGGMTDMYLANGTYMKSMYALMMAPSCVKVQTMQTRNPRIHHRITWDHAVPKIINQRYSKRIRS